MNAYEGMFVIDTRSARKETEEPEELIRSLLEKVGGEIALMKRWDDRKLAYEINGRNTGLYLLTYFRGGPDTVMKLNRECRLAQAVLRALFLRVKEIPEADSVLTASELRSRDSDRPEGRGRDGDRSDGRRRSGGAPAPGKGPAPDAPKKAAAPAAEAPAEKEPAENAPAAEAAPAAAAPAAAEATPAKEGPAAEAPAVSEGDGASAEPAAETAPPAPENSAESGAPAPDAGSPDKQ